MIVARMSHWRWRETKQQPSRVRPSNQMLLNFPPFPVHHPGDDHGSHNIDGPNQNSSDLSLRMQQAVSRSFSLDSLISRDSVSSHRMHGAYLAPRWIRVVCKARRDDKQDKGASIYDVHIEGEGGLAQKKMY